MEISNEELYKQIILMHNKLDLCLCLFKRIENYLVSGFSVSKSQREYHLKSINKTYDEIKKAFQIGENDGNSKL